jgi:hypothetical protein
MENTDINVNFVGDKVMELDQLLNAAHDKYLNLRKELAQYEGRPLADDAIKVNEILTDIQNLYANELYPIHYFITLRNQFALNAVNEYGDFIEMLKRNGATNNEEAKLVDPTQPEIIN